MNKIEITCIILIFVLCISCSNHKDRSDYIFSTDKSSIEWQSKLKDVGFVKSLNNSVLLISHTAHCSSCLSELEKWNSFAADHSENENIFLIVVERYESRYQNFVSGHAQHISSLRDSSSVLVEEGFIPSIPAKIYFDVSGEPVSIHPLGGDIFLDEFIDNLDSIHEF